MSNNLIDKHSGEMNETMAMRILRDHRHEDYKPDNHFLMNRVCKHAANKLSRFDQTTGSLIAHLKPGLQTYWATGTSAPCTGIFKPVWFRGKVLPDIGPVPDGTFNPDTLWWYHEMLHRSVLLDYPARLGAFKKDRDKLEASFIKKAGDIVAKNRWAFSSEAFSRARDETGKWIASVRNRPVRRRPKLYYRLYWAKQNRKAGITVT